MRRRKAEIRVLPKDLVYNSELVTQLINRLMISGKKEIAKNTVYKAMEKVQQEKREKALEVLEQAIKNIEPVLELRSRRIGGQNYQIPIEIGEIRESDRGSQNRRGISEGKKSSNAKRRRSLAIRWLVLNARKRKGANMIEKLASEIIEASEEKGGAVAKKEEVHKSAEANKAFAHFRW